jgi:DNA-binding GntR family transcriptional regulator
MTPQGKAAQAYREIERLIVFQKVAPGSLISEAVLMEMTGFGRTPVREALQLLARNRMVEIHANKGVLIPPTSVEAQLRMLELRRVLEALSVRLACHRATDRDRDGMRAMVALLHSRGFNLHDYAETVKDTHHLIVGAAHNEYLADSMAPLQGLSRRFWFTHVVNEAVEIKTGAQLHSAILRTILDRDPLAAEQASHELNDYLVEFAYRSLRRDHDAAMGP